MSSSNKRGRGRDTADDVTSKKGRIDKIVPKAAVEESVDETSASGSKTDVKGKQIAIEAVTKVEKNAGVRTSDPDFRDLNVGEDNKERIVAMSNFEDKDKAIYSLAKLATHLTWAFKGTGQYVVDDKTKRVLAWILGVVDYKDVTHGEKLLSINVDPLDGADFDKAVAFMEGLTDAKIRSNVNSYDTLRCSAWGPAHRTRKNDVEGDTTGESALNRFFDATEKFDKANMPRIELDDIKEGDIVLVESFVKKFYPKKGNVKGNSHQASLDLVAVSLLHSATDEEHDEYMAQKQANKAKYVATSDDVVF